MKTLNDVRECVAEMYRTLRAIENGWWLFELDRLEQELSEARDDGPFATDREPIKKMMRVLKEKLKRAKGPTLEPEQLSVRGDTIRAELWYPRCEGRPRYVEIDLVDVRASDGIRISYDFERDGWSIEQASTFEWHADAATYDYDWQEVAFVPSWGREGAWGTLDYVAAEDPSLDEPVPFRNVRFLRRFAEIIRNGGGDFHSETRGTYDPSTQERLDAAHHFELWADYYAQAFRDGHVVEQRVLHGCQSYEPAQVTAS